MTGFDEFESAFRHDGQILRLSWLVDCASSLKWIVTSLCMDIGCGLSSGDEGHMGTTLFFLLAAGSLLSCTSGVRDGVQKEGSVGFAACRCWLAKGPCGCWGFKVEETDLFVVNGLSCLDLVFCCYASELILIECELPFGSSVKNHSVRRFVSRSRDRCGDPLLGGGREPCLRHLKVANGSLAVLLVLGGLDALGFPLSIMTALFSPLQFLLLGQEVLKRALAAEDVAMQAGDGLPGDAEAQAAGAKGKEGLAIETG